MARVSFAAVCFLPWSLSALGQGLTPEESLRRMRVPAGLEVSLVAAEPLVRQPVAIDFDRRGRLWVLQYLQYPNPAGLRRVQVDRYSRTVYDRVPEPPPRGPRGDDRLTILADTDGDGRADQARDFVAGLNIASGFAFGHGEVLVLQAPYLLAYADRDGDDAPDGDPRVLLGGFGLDDASAVANSLVRGPDGWLYGAQGSTVTAEVRGLRFQQAVWRYHLDTDRFELFSEGGGNTWGLDFDELGRLFASTNVGGFVALHVVQGGYYWKSFEKHGGFTNPFTFGHLEHAPHTGFAGGHVTAGGVIYQGTTFPESFRGKLIAANVLSHAVYWHHVTPCGTTFATAHGGALLETDDPWFAPCDVTVGPDGAVYVADWYDRRTAHPDPDAEWDRSNGRIYRVAAAGARPAAVVDASRLDDGELVSWLTSRDGWQARQARDIAAGRKDLYQTLAAMALDRKDRRRALAGLWALAARGELTGEIASKLLGSGDEAVRSWAVRLIGDGVALASVHGEALAMLARSERSPWVRSQLASTARRLPPARCLEIAGALCEDDLYRADPHFPLLLWWDVEAAAFTGRELVLRRFACSDAWKSALTREDILPRLVRRYAAAGADADLESCARLLRAAPSPDEVIRLAAALDAGLAAQRSGPVPAALGDLLDRIATAQPLSPIILRVRVRLRCAGALEQARRVALEPTAGEESRVAAIGALGEIAGADDADTLLAATRPSQPEAVRVAAVAAASRCTDERVPAALLPLCRDGSPGLRAAARAALLARPAWAAGFVAAVERGDIPAAEVPPDAQRRIAAHGDASLDARVRKLWGSVRAATPGEKLAEVRRLQNDLRAAGGDAARGREHFVRLCGTCHKLLGEGGSVGPELTTANRDDREALLVSIVDPGAQVRREFLSYTVATRDGRALAGRLEEVDAGRLVVIAAGGERTELARGEVAQLEESEMPLMPEGLLGKLTPQELRDLFAYLQRH